MFGLGGIVIYLSKHSNFDVTHLVQAVTGQSVINEYINIFCIPKFYSLFLFLAEFQLNRRIYNYTDAELYNSCSFFITLIFRERKREAVKLFSLYITVTVVKVSTKYLT
jgi:hypothetical protein